MKTQRLQRNSVCMKVPSNFMYFLVLPSETMSSAFTCHAHCAPQRRKKSQFLFLLPFPPSYMSSFCDKPYSLVAQMVKNLPTMRETLVQSLVQDYPLEQEMATHPSILAWRSPQTEEPGGLLSMETQDSDTTERLKLCFFLSFCH